MAEQMTITYGFDEASLVKRLSKLSLRTKATFSLCCATRQLSAWDEYARRFAPDSEVVAREIANSIWEFLRSNNISMNWGAMIERVTALFPDEPDSWSPFHVYSDDAIASLGYTVLCLKNPSESDQQAAWSARRACEAAEQAAIRELGVQRGIGNAEYRIRTHSIPQRELARQKRDLKMLEAETLSNALNELRSLAYSEQTLSLDEMLA